MKQQQSYAKVQEGKLRGKFNSKDSSLKYKMMKKAIQGYFNINNHPCADVPTLIRQRNYVMDIFPEMGTPESATNMWQSIYKLIQDRPSDHSEPCDSYFAIFDEVEIANEDHFELLLWTQLQYAPCKEIKEVSPDEHFLQMPNDPDFSIDIAGRFLHIAGMHPRSQRKSRRFPWPVLIFNICD